MAKQTVAVTIEFQVRIPGFDGQEAKTFEYTLEGAMKAKHARDADDEERERHIRKLIAKAFKKAARKRAPS